MSLFTLVGLIDFLCSLFLSLWELLFLDDERRSNRRRFDLDRLRDQKSMRQKKWYPNKTLGATNYHISVKTVTLGPDKD